MVEQLNRIVIEEMPAVLAQVDPAGERERLPRRKGGSFFSPQIAVLQPGFAAGAFHACSNQGWDSSGSIFQCQIEIAETVRRAVFSVHVPDCQIAVAPYRPGSMFRLGSGIVEVKIKRRLFLLLNCGKPDPADQLFFRCVHGFDFMRKNCFPVGGCESQVASVRLDFGKEFISVQPDAYREIFKISRRRFFRQTQAHPVCGTVFEPFLCIRRNSCGNQRRA